ncbi:hypothetical protein D9M68_573720 [compost metagenome]
MHRQVLAHFFGARVLDQHANAAAVHVAGQRVGGLDALEAADRHVFADLADQGGAGRFDRAFAVRQRRQRGHVGRVLRGDQFGQLVHESHEVVVLGDEVGFAVNFDDGALLGVGGDEQTDQAFSGDAGGGLAGLVAQLDAQDFLGAGQVALGFRQGLLALHHGGVGLFAQFLDQGSGNFSHVCSNFARDLPRRAGTVV